MITTLKSCPDQAVWVIYRPGLPSPTRGNFRFQIGLIVMTLRPWLSVWSSPWRHRELQRRIILWGGSASAAPVLRSPIVFPARCTGVGMLGLDPAYAFPLRPLCLCGFNSLSRIRLCRFVESCVVRISYCRRVLGPCCTGGASGTPMLLVLLSLTGFLAADLCVPLALPVQFPCYGRQLCYQPDARLWECWVSAQPTFFSVTSVSLWF